MVSTKAEGTRINVVKYIFLGFVLGYAFSLLVPNGMPLLMVTLYSFVDGQSYQMWLGK